MSTQSALHSFLAPLVGLNDWLMRESALWRFFVICAGRLTVDRENLIRNIFKLGIQLNSFLQNRMLVLAMLKMEIRY